MDYVLKDRYIRPMINIAYSIASLSYAEKKKVGAVIVNSKGHIIATGFNGTYPGAQNICEDKKGKTIHNLVIHAENNCLKRIEEYNLSDQKDLVLICTTAPCLSCSELILKSNIISVIYEEDYKNDLGVLNIKNNSNIKVQKYE